MRPKKKKFNKIIGVIYQIGFAFCAGQVCGTKPLCHLNIVILYLFYIVVPEMVTPTTVPIIVPIIGINLSASSTVVTTLLTVIKIKECERERSGKEKKEK